MQKIKCLALVVGGLALSPIVAVAQQAAPPQTTQQVAPADDPNEMVCHAGAPILGSRFPGPRICHTRKEWEQIRRDSQDALFHIQMERSCNAGTQC
jgi:hypothetical protein